MGVMQRFLPLADEAAALAVAGATAEAPALPGPIEFLLSLIPSNPFQAAAEGALLPLIVFTVFFAAAVLDEPLSLRTVGGGLITVIGVAIIQLRSTYKVEPNP